MIEGYELYDDEARKVIGVSEVCLLIIRAQNFRSEVKNKNHIAVDDGVKEVHVLSDLDISEDGNLYQNQITFGMVREVMLKMLRTKTIMFSNPLENFIKSIFIPSYFVAQIKFVTLHVSCWKLGRSYRVHFHRTRRAIRKLC